MRLPSRLKSICSEISQKTKFERKNSESSDGSETQFCRATEKKENVEVWDDWGDKEEGAAENSLESDESIRNWLFRCDLKTYSDAEYLLVTWESRFVVLRKPPDEPVYKIVCKQYIEGDPISNEITASSIFGLSNVRHIELLDSIIIALGTLDGHVYFFTEQGTMLYFDRFSIFEPVNSLQFEVVKTGQTFIVVFTKGFFMINPISLKSVLYQAKVLIAKCEKTVKQISESIELQSELLAPDIKGNIIHVIFTGLHKPSTLEQYISASYDSFYAKVEKPSLPLYSTFMVTTEKEFAVFVWHDREEQDKLIDDVIKYGKSLVPSFGIRKFFGISTEPARIASHMRSAVHAPTRSIIMETRVAQNVSRSPDCQYVAVTDRMARVLVIDIASRQVVLIFKGYRDASISWVSVTEDDRVAQFLTIFAPRRSLLEVWTVLGNVRVCAQHVPSSECNVVTGGENKMLCGRCHVHTDSNSFFIDEKGEFHRIALPFHLALTSRSRQDQHDHLLLKQLENTKTGGEDWFQTFSDLKMATSRKTTFQNALHNLSTAEEAHQFIARIRSIPTSASLGDLPNSAEKSIGFYARTVAETKPPVGEYDDKDTSNYKLDSIVERILECHMQKFGERTDMLNDSEVMKVGEWLKYVDLSQEDIDVFSEHWSEKQRHCLANLIFGPLFGSFEIDEYYDTVLEKIPVKRKNIVKLFYMRFEKTTTHIDWRIFNRIVEMFLNLEKSETGILEQVDQMAMDSKDVPLGMILLSICWCARIQIRILKGNDEDEVENDHDLEEEDEKNKTIDEWDAISPEAEHLDCIIMCLHCVSLAQSLLKDDSNILRISDVVPRIDSYIRENVAKWIVSTPIDTDTIEKLFPRDPSENLAEKGNEEDRRKQMIIDFPDDKEVVIQRMYQIIPRVFEHDLVVADVCWEMMSQWFREKDDNFSYIKDCTTLLPQSIVDPRLRHGIARLIWDKFIFMVFQSIVNMVEKTGRRPKDKETRKEIGFGEVKLEEFLMECEKFLEVLMDSVRDMPPPIDFKQDLLVEMASSSFAAHLHQSKTAYRQDQFAILASRQPLVNFHLVLHHQHLALALRLQLTTGLRFHPLRNLFCVTGNRAFFASLDSHPLIPLDRVDDATMEKRHAFLVKVAEQGSMEERRLARHLEMEWKLTVNEISFMQALSSFRLGNDHQGSLELASCVRDDRSAVALARVLAARLIQLANEANKRYSTAHSQYLCALAGEEAARVELYENSPDDPLVDSNPKTWKDAVTSLGRAGNSVPQSAQAAIPFVRMNDIAKLYFGAQWVNN
ncbi:Rab3 GTPase-activating protein regulatory subunit [Caenorhabditis elegans]|uniref:Isoform b of Rab3 GTPase-activating protein regulatory subunit n=1 Tax=Caenorhabditis elegans TaxID=6239 RepID=Q22670-2|nr:Rab3 GTPase-activating protein regulatory subunit [Caenorhabditis elegans]CAE54924.1 Rab3 GTPase-activating protein regulatory subunit [Caenorhabditis elegans]|eukprot:NP_001021632.1 Rab3 GTPase-activating protein regulatory subunit [Caenorhabditis elegans]